MWAFQARLKPNSDTPDMYTLERITARLTETAASKFDEALDTILKEIKVQLGSYEVLKRAKSGKGIFAVLYCKRDVNEKALDSWLKDMKFRSFGVSGWRKEVDGNTVIIEYSLAANVVCVYVG